MPTIETIARPRRNRVSVPVPEEYGLYPFRVILVPLAPEEPVPSARRTRRSRRRTFVDALLACPKIGEGESLDVSRDSSDCGRDMEGMGLRLPILNPFSAN